MSDELKELVSLAIAEGCQIESGSIQSHTKALIKRQNQEQIVIASIEQDKADAERWRKLEKLHAESTKGILLEKADDGRAEIFIDEWGTPRDGNTLADAIDSIKE